VTVPRPDLEPLRRLLRTGTHGRKLGPAERLAHAVTGEPAATLSCADAQAQLPVCADAELRGIPIAQRYPEVARHLLTCQECGALYALMLDRELAPALEPLPAPARLNVLLRQQRFEEVRRFVLGIAETVLETIRPAALPGLADAAQVFFDQVRALGGAFRLEPAAAHALGQGSDLSPAVRVLMASYLATQRLAQARPEGQGDVAPALGLSRPAIHGAALAAADESGLRGAEAKRFADAYADLLAAWRIALPEWPADE